MSMNIMWARYPFAAVRVAGAWSWSLTSLLFLTWKCAWSYTFTPICVFMAWSLTYYLMSMRNVQLSFVRGFNVLTENELIVPGNIQVITFCKNDI
jgi:hypothetical protein